MVSGEVNDVVSHVVKAFDKVSHQRLLLKLIGNQLDRRMAYTQKTEST